MGRPNNPIGAKRKTRTTAKAKEQVPKTETKKDEGLEPSSSDEIQGTNESKIEKQTKQKEDNTSLLNDEESNIEDAKPKAKDKDENSNNENTISNIENTNVNKEPSKEETKINDIEETKLNDKEETKQNDQNLNEETKTIQNPEDKQTKKDKTIPKEIDAESLSSSSCESEETSTITLNTDQLRNK